MRDCLMTYSSQSKKYTALRFECEIVYTCNYSCDIMSNRLYTKVLVHHVSIHTSSLHMDMFTYIVEHLCMQCSHIQYTHITISPCTHKHAHNQSYTEPFTQHMHNTHTHTHSCMKPLKHVLHTTFCGGFFVFGRSNTILFCW